VESRFNAPANKEFFKGIRQELPFAPPRAVIPLHKEALVFCKPPTLLPIWRAYPTPPDPKSVRPSQ
jgi:hypothetical protein